jgi:paraquat-inducible protein B
MSLRAKPFFLIIFVCGAVALAAAATWMVGRGDLFHQQQPFIIYFADSVNGLAPGSPVKFKGVPIGQVKNIMIRFNQAAANASIPVLIEVDVTRLHQDLGVTVDLGNEQEFTEQVRSGLRATVEQESLQSADSYINLDYYDNLAGAAAPASSQLEHKFLEIPSLTRPESALTKFAADHS